MIAALLKLSLRRFARRFDYDVTYLARLVEADVSGGMKVALASPLMRHQFGAPAALYHAAKIRAVKGADCGPCLRLAFQMAAEAGVPWSILQPVVGIGAPDRDTALVIAYVDAVLSNADGLADLIAQVKNRWSQAVLAGLAAAIVAGQFYPLLKRGIGHGASCEPFLQELSQTISEKKADASVR